MFSPPLFYLIFYQRPDTFTEEPSEVGFFQSFFFIKFLENRLKVFQIKNLVLHLFLLKLRVKFDSALGCVNKSLGVPKILFKKSLGINPKQGFYLTLIFELVWVVTDPPTKKRSSKWGAVWPSSASSIEINFVLLAEVIAFHLWLSVIEVWKLCLQLAFSWSFLMIFLEE